MVSKCVCLGKQSHTRRVGHVVGTSCQCRGDNKDRMDNKDKEDNKNRGDDKDKMIARAVCCSSRREEEEGDRVFHQTFV